MHTPDRPVLDAESFQQLLAAAFVLQEHNDRLRATAPPGDYTRALSIIADTQRLIQNRQLDLAAAAKLIAEHTRKATSATGTAVAVIQGDQLVYRAGAGSAGIAAGLEVPIEASLPAVCVREGKILQCLDTHKDPRFSPELCHAQNVRCFVAIPVYHEGKVAGVLELRSAEPNSFREHDVHTSQLMAGLVSEAIARATEMDWKQALAAERAVMLEALEKLKPQLERLAEQPAPPPQKTEPLAAAQVPEVLQSDAANSAGTDHLAPTLPFDAPAVDVAANAVALGAAESSAASVNNVAPPPAVPVTHPRQPDVRKAGTELCRVCDHPLAEEEFFCGICGTARPGDKSVAHAAQGKWGMVWRLQKPVETRPNDLSASASEAAGGDEATATLPASLEGIVAHNTVESRALEFEDSVEEHTVAKRVTADDTMIRRAAAQSSRFGDIAQEFAPEDSVTEAAAELGPDAAAHLTPEEEVQLALMRDSIPAPVEIAPPSPWTSATKARAWLESLTGRQQPGRIWLDKQWHAHRANVYLAASALLLLVVLLQVVFSRGSKPSAQDSASRGASVAANARRRLPPKPELTMFEQLLVSLGLAEPPPTPTYLGNPSTQVWVDLHTALYYCPGADLYGKTPDGKFTTQRDAQQDQFEPARRRACD